MCDPADRAADGPIEREVPESPADAAVGSTPPGSERNGVGPLGETAGLSPPDRPVTFGRRLLHPAIRWVWLGRSLLAAVVFTLMVLPLDIFVSPTPPGVASAGFFAVWAGVAVWRASSRYRRWTWQLTEHDLIIDRGVVFHLNRIVPRVRVQHVDLSSGPLDRLLGLRQVAIYTAGTREADATIPGLEADVAESLRRALIAR